MYCFSIFYDRPQTRHACSSRLISVSTSLPASTFPAASSFCAKHTLGSLLKVLNSDNCTVIFIRRAAQHRLLRIRQNTFASLLSYPDEQQSDRLASNSECISEKLLLPSWLHHTTVLSFNSTSQYTQSLAYCMMKIILIKILSFYINSVLMWSNHVRKCRTWLQL